MPDWNDEIAKRLVDLKLSPVREAEIVEELTAHLEDRYRELLGSGLAEAEAYGTALADVQDNELLARELQFVERPVYTETGGSRDEVRLAIRRLMKRPAATLAAVVTLAFGIGAAAATWSLLSAVLLHPLPVEEPERLVVAGQFDNPAREQAGTLRNGFIYPFFPHIRDSGIFERIVAQWIGPQSLNVSRGGVTAEAAVAFASHDYFEVLGVRIPLGRGFVPDDDRRGAAPVAILTDRYWRLNFDADPAAIGQTITLRDKTVTIVGVAARGFRGLDLSQSPDLYLPFHTIADVGYPSTNYFAEAKTGFSPTAGTLIIGRLHPDQSAAQAAARLSILPPLPGRPGEPKIGITDLETAAIPAAARSGMSQFARLLGMTVGLLLLIGCATVGMFLLIRTEARREEFAMCLALGASRGRLRKGVAIEGGLLASAGGLLALPVAWWLFSGVRAFQLPGSINVELLELTLDARVFVACLASAMLATALISLVAGAFGFPADIGDALRSCAGASARLSRRRTHAALVAGQVAVALVLLAGAGLFARSIMAALSLNSGIDMGRVVTGWVGLENGYDAPRGNAFFDDLFARLRANPAIRSIAFSYPQGGMTSAGKITIDGVPRQFPSFLAYTTVDPDYFRTMGIPLLRGRDFSSDDRTGRPLVVIVSESFGRLLAEGGDPLGRRVPSLSHMPDKPYDMMEVVGVVADVVTNIAALEPLAVYFPIAQSNVPLSRLLVVRAAGDADWARREIMSAVKQMDSTVVPGPMLTLEERIGEQMTSQRFGVSVMGTLGVIAFLLTLVGTYVLAESMAVRRMREMGIRAALGATGKQLAAIVLAETVRLVGLGLAAGLLLTWAGAGTIRTFLFGVQPLDPATLVAMAGLILVLAMAVTLRPAVCAARVDPARVLREE